MERALSFRRELRGIQRCTFTVVSKNKYVGCPVAKKIDYDFSNTMFTEYCVRGTCTYLIDRNATLTGVPGEGVRGILVVADMFGSRIEASFYLPETMDHVHRDFAYLDWVPFQRLE